MSATVQRCFAGLVAVASLLGLALATVSALD
jgi:hypothetical protein